MPNHYDSRGPEYLYLYQAEGLTTGEIAERLGVRQGSVTEWFRAHHPGLLRANNRRRRPYPRYSPGAELSGGATVVGPLVGSDRLIRCRCGREFSRSAESLANSRAKGRPVECAVCGRARRKAK